MDKFQKAVLISGCVLIGLAMGYSLVPHPQQRKHVEAVLRSAEGSLTGCKVVARGDDSSTIMFAEQVLSGFGAEAKSADKAHTLVLSVRSPITDPTVEIRNGSGKVIGQVSAPFSDRLLVRYHLAQWAVRYKKGGLKSVRAIVSADQPRASKALEIRELTHYLLMRGTDRIRHERRNISITQRRSLLKLHRLVIFLGTLWAMAQARVWNAKLANLVMNHSHSRLCFSVVVLASYAAEMALAVWVTVTLSAREQQERAREKVINSGPGGPNAGPRNPGPNDLVAR